MAKVTGIGGIFFKTGDPGRLRAWYREYLGIDCGEGEFRAFDWREAGVPERRGYTIWAPFSTDTTYFAPSTAAFMINYRVDDLDGMVEQLRAAGIAVDLPKDDDPNGRFAWLSDPEGNRVELWEPSDLSPDEGTPGPE